MVKLIRASKTPEEARDGLMERFSLSEIQAKAILDMRLQKLTGLEHDKLLEELAELMKKIEYFTSILENEEVLKGVIREELVEIKENYSTPRRSELLMDDPDSIDIRGPHSGRGNGHHPVAQRLHQAHSAFQLHGPAPGRKGHLGRTDPPTAISSTPSC